MTTCQVLDGKTIKGAYLVTGHNELVVFTNQATNEVDFKFYDKEAEHGHVTCLTTSGNLLAIGFSSGTILVLDLDLANNGGPEEPESHNPF